jgi:hypothetical protein
MTRIADFKAQMATGGARANQFRVTLTFPSFVTHAAGYTAQFLSKATSLPSSSINDIPIQYRGRAVHFAGERTFQPWHITAYTDNNFLIRNAMEEWAHGIQEVNTTNGRVNTRDYQVDLYVHQLDRSGSIVKEYKFIDAYPSEVGPIQLDYEQTNAIETFDVLFQYNFWESVNSTTAVLPSY